MAEIKHFKVVASLPSLLEPDSIYYVRVGQGYDQYVTNGVGVVVAYEANSKLDLEGKVDKESGKQLSDENYTLDEKNKLASLENYDDSAIQAELDTKVDKIVGKGLSTEDFTPTEKDKLAGVAVEATKNDTDAQLRDRATHTGVQPISSISGLQSELDSKADTTYVDTQLDTKVDKVAGKGLSSNDFTDQLRDKLASLESSHFRGTFTSKEDLELAIPVAEAGDYADVDVAGQDAERYIWDSSDSIWVLSTSKPTPLTAAQIKQLYESNPDTNPFDDAAEAKLEGIADGATANRTDAYLLDRANHTGAQEISTVTGLTASLNSKADQTSLDAVAASKVDKEDGKGLSDENFSLEEKQKLAGIEDEATRNSTDVQLRDRSTHTGTQPASTITGLASVATSGNYEDLSNTPDLGSAAFNETEDFDPSGSASDAQAFSIQRSNHTGVQPISTVSGLQAELDTKVDKVAGKELSANDFTDTLKDKLEGLENFDDSAIQAELDTKVDKVAGKGLSDENYTLAEKSKLSGIQAGATANATNAQLRDRATHTGVQPIASVEGLQDALDEKVDNTDPRLTDAREWTASVVTQTEAQAGTSTTARKWTSQRVRQATAGWWDTSTFKTKLDGIEAGAEVNTVDSVNGATGTVVLDTGDISEGTNLYHTAARARGAISVSGDLSYSSTSGVISFNETYSSATDLLTAIKTVDGSSSGLDADLLDGKHASAFATSAQGGRADSAVQPGDLAAVATSGSYNDLTNKPDLSALEEVLVYSSQSTFPPTGESGKVYIAEDTGYMYRWNGSGYTQLTDQTAIWGQISGTLSDQTDLQSALNGKANTTTQVIAGTGLSGGGNLSANRTLNVQYGTTAGTAAQGNDSRLSDSREWTASTVSQAEAEAGTATTARKWTSQRVRQATLAWWNTGTATVISSTGEQALAEALDSRVIFVNTITDLQALDTSGLVDGQQVNVREYQSWAGIGGGTYCWDSTRDKADHNGGSIISPTVPWDGDESGHQDFLNGVDESDGAGSGCWVLKGEPSITSFGAYKSLTKDQGYVLQAFNSYADSSGKRDLILPNNFELFLASKESISFSSIKSSRATIKGRIELTNGNKVNVSGIDFTLDDGWTAKNDTWALSDSTDGHLRVSGCSFDGAWVSKVFSGTGLSAGIEVTNCDFEGVSNSEIANSIEVHQSAESVVINNRFPGRYYRHVKLSGPVGDEANTNLVVRINGNTFNGSVHSEKQIIDAYTCARLFMVSNNHFTPSNKVENFLGYKSEGTAGDSPYHDKVIISNNIAIGEVVDFGFFMGGGYGLVGNYTEQALTFSGNIIEIQNTDFSAAVRATYIHHVNMTGNTILTGNNQLYGIRVTSPKTVSISNNPFVMGNLWVEGQVRVNSTPCKAITISANTTEVDTSVTYGVGVTSLNMDGATSTVNVGNNSVHRQGGTREEFRFLSISARALNLVGNTVSTTGYAVSLGNNVNIARFTESGNSWQPQNLSVSSAPVGVGQIRVNSGNAYIAVGTSASSDWKLIT